MKKTLLIIALLCTTVIVVAQNPRQERIRSLKIAFITERVNLTSEEAQQFWPIYNTYDEAMEKIRRKERSLLRDMKGNFDIMTENEGKEALDNLISQEQKKINAKQVLITQLKDVISSKKILTLLKAEEDFKRNLIEQLRNRRGRPRGNR